MFISGIFCYILYITEKKLIFLPNNLRKSRTFLEKLSINVLADVAQWVGYHPANRKVTSLTPSQGTFKGCRLCALPPSGCLQKAEDNQWMFLSLSFSLSLPLSKTKFKNYF